MNSVESVSSESLGGSTGLGSLLLDGSGSGYLSGSLGLNFGSNGSLGVGVNLLHHLSVLKRVLLGLIVSSGGSLDFSKSGLNLVGVNNSSEVSTFHGGTVESASSLLDTSLSGGSEDVVKSSEGGRSVDNESSEVTTRGELEEVKSVDVASVNSGQVSRVLVNVGIFIVEDKEGSLSHGESGVSEFTLTGSHVLGSTDSSEISGGTESLESGEHGTGGLVRVKVGNHGEFGDGVNSVSSGENEGSASGGSEASSDGVSLLLGVDLSVPFSPGSEGSEHATLSAHVTESGLSSSGGTRSGNSGNTSDSTSSTPRLGGVLMSLLVENTVSLTSVLSHVGVAEGNDIISDGSRENGGHSGLSGDGNNLLFSSVYGANGAGGHSKFIELTN